MPRDVDSDPIRVPGSVRFPVELAAPPGFDPGDPATWPRVEGRLEWVAGRLLYMPPCGVSQQGTVASVVIALGAWQKTHREFFVGTGEAGMVLEGDARGADAAVFRRDAIDTGERRFARVPPILAVEVEGRDEGEHELHTKAAWYLARGVSVVWVVLDATREVLAIGLGGETRYGLGERLPAHPALPGLEPEVAELFEQLG